MAGSTCDQSLFAAISSRMSCSLVSGGRLVGEQAAVEARKLAR